ncbi:hypothetical protein [Halorhabdus salina]|uniref:hypothetical protein n=1 Tax=Halorhabdus salina TaxID=2750670 RepID=UPI0015EE3EE9|nr:hypothetical protein [Halorhabdus salina]
MVAGTLLAVVIYLGLLGGSGLFVVAGVISVRDGFRKYRERKAITDRPVSELDSVAMGDVALQGTALPEGARETVPIGEQPDAIVYRITVDDTNKLEAELLADRHTPRFIISSGEDEIRVDPSEFTFEIDQEHTWSKTIESSDPIPPDLEAYVAEHDLPEQGFDRDRQFQYEYLPPGETIHVVGHAIPRTDSTDPREKGVLVTAERDKSLISNKSVETLLDERRRAVITDVTVGVLEGGVGLAVFLWLSGIAQLFLGV